MKITLFATVAFTAVVGLAFADELYNNWNNNNNGIGGGISVGGGLGQLSSGSFGHFGSGYSSGYGSGYSSGYGSSHGAGYGSSYGVGYGAGYGSSKAAYVPVPAVPQTGGSGLGSFFPLIMLLVLLPLLFNQSTTGRDQVILLNSTVRG